MTKPKSIISINVGFGQKWKVPEGYTAFLLPNEVLYGHFWKHGIWLGPKVYAAFKNWCMEHLSTEPNSWRIVIVKNNITQNKAYLISNNENDQVLFRLRWTGKIV